jgi:hypothetical protein
MIKCTKGQVRWLERMHAAKTTGMTLWTCETQLGGGFALGSLSNSRAAIR